MSAYMFRSAEIFVALIVSCAAIWAQSAARINGRVTDATGAVIPGAEIRVTQTDTNAVRTTTSGEDGSYVLADLPIGPYTLDASKEGFTKYRQSGIVLQVGSNPTIDVPLSVGNVTEQVEVQANAALVDTQATGVGQVIDNQRVLELPLTARNSQQLIILAGGAVGGGTQAANNNYPVTLISVAGAQTDAVTYVLDGGTHNENYIHSALPSPFPDALQEFRVESSAAPARYGSAGGVVEMVTKSGTNQFHGTAFEFLRNGALNARNTFAAKVDQLKRHQFGGVIGGPIKKDKLFFFFGDQYTKTISVPNVSFANVITAKALAGDWTDLTSPACNGARQITLRDPFVDNRISPSLYAAPAVALTRQKNWVIPDNPCGIDTFTLSANSDEQMIVGKVDYQMGAKHSIFGRSMAALLSQPGSFDGHDIISLAVPDYTRRALSLVIGDTYLINSSTIATFRATAVRTSNSRTTGDFFNLTDLGVKGLYYPPNLPKQAQISVTGAFNLAGPAPNFSNGTSFQETGDINMTRGVHQIGFGASLLHAYLASLNSVNAPGQFIFTAANTGSALADFMLGLSSTFMQSQPATTYLKQYSTAVYFQDTWKANRNVTVIGGLRWEPYLSPYTQYLQAAVFSNDWFLQGRRSTVFKNAPAGLLYSGDPGVSLGNSLQSNSWARFEPRLGVAWDPKGDGKMVVRVSAGKFFDDIHLGANSSNIALAPPTGGRVSISGASLADPWAGIPAGSPFPLVYGLNAIYPLSNTMSTVPFGLKQPTAWHWNTVIQKQVTANWVATAAYAGSLAVHEVSGHESNPGVFIPGNCVAGQYGLTAPGPCSTQGNVNQRRFLFLENPDQGKYFSNFATIDSSGTRSYNGLLLSLQGRIRTGFTVLANHTWAHCIDYGITTNQTTIQTWDLSQRSNHRGNCELDRRQNFNLSAVYQTPQFTNHVAKTLATGWQVSTVTRALTGSWVSVQTGVNNSLTGTSDQFPNIVAGVSPYAANRGAKSRIWLNPAAFSQPVAGTYGNMASQSIQGPGSFNVDVALARLFRIKEGLTVQLRAEAFNVLNHVNPGGATAPASGMNNAGLNSAATLRSGIALTLTDPLFGRIVNAADPRIMQLAMKLTF